MTAQKATIAVAQPGRARVFIIEAKEYTYLPGQPKPPKMVSFASAP
jgi:hypothetical protein